MDTLRQDIRYGLRSLARRPGLTLVAAASLALGIGANTAIFSALDVFLIRPLPYPQADRLVTVWTTNPDRGWSAVNLSLPDALDYRTQARTTDLAIYDGTTINLTGETEPERLDALRTSTNFFRVIGYVPAIGRSFLPEEERSGDDRVAVLSRGLWERRFGADPGLVGQTVTLNSVPYTVVGVMGVHVPDPYREVDVWLPLGVTGKEERASRAYAAIGRLRPGATLDAARAEFTKMARGLATAYPDADVGNGANVVSLHDQLFDAEFRQASLIVTVAVAFVLLIACANVANLLLARATGREREIAVRVALGAGRLRIARQLLTESVVLGLLGGVLGLGVAALGVKGLVAIMPAGVPRVEEIGLDPRALGFLFLVSALSGILVGVIPTLRASRPNLRDSLQEGGGGRTPGRRGGRMRSALAVAQIALALALLISSTLLVRSYVNLRSIHLAYRTDHILTFRTSLPNETYRDDGAVRQFYASLVEQVQDLPGVQSAAAVSAFPSDDRHGSATYYEVEGREVPEGQRPVVTFRTATPGYFRTLGLDLIQGRLFDARDGEDAPPVAIITEGFAKKLWPGERAVGKRLVFSSATREVVGVIEDHRIGGPDDDPPYDAVFFPAAQSPSRSMAIVVHTTGAPEALVPAVRASVRSVDPAQPIYAIKTLQASVLEDLSGNRVMPQIIGTLAVVALILALIGVYGVVAYGVAQRVHEMGLRMALGAQARDVLRLVVRQGLGLAGLGVTIGLLISLAVTRGLSTFLWGVGSFDLLTFASGAVLLLAAGLAASYLPARRATRVDPIVALRSE